MLPSFHEPQGLLWPNIFEQRASITPATLQRGEFSFLVLANEPNVVWGLWWGPRMYKINSFYRLKSYNPLNKYWREHSRKWGQLEKHKESVSGYTWNTTPADIPAPQPRQHSGDRSGSEWAFPGPTALFVLSQSLDNRQREQECSDVHGLLGGEQPVSWCATTAIMCGSHNDLYS